MSSSAVSAAPVGFNPSFVNDEFVVGGMGQAVAADWLPDGRMVVLGKSGEVYLVNASNGTKSLLFTLPDVDSRGESGALDLVVDLNFATNRTFYVYYSAQSNFRLRIARIVLNAGLTGLSSNTTIWSNPGPLRTVFADPTNHIGGALDIGPDGKFYLSIGDALANLSQDLSNVFGKVLRINLDGSVPTDNPVIPGKTIGEIWAYGMRNPYRSQFERGRTVANPLGTPAAPYWIADVGGNVAESAYEEINLGEAGKNYGWPLCEGPVGANGNPAHVACPAGVTGPTLSYPHAIGVQCCFNKAVIGGQMYRSGPFPLSGYYIFGDYPSSTISWMQLDGTGRVSNDSGLIKQLQTNGQDEAPVWIDISPDGNIYFLDIFTGNLRRLTYSGGSTNVPPVITTASATPLSGQAPLTVSFNGAATDANGDAIAYLWNFGDGTTSNVASPTHAYATAGSYQARLQVTAGGQTVNANPLTITVGSPPVVAITSPANGSGFVAGSVITVNASGIADGAPLAPSAMTWTVVFRHDTHTHPVLSGVTGSSVSFTVPTSGHEFAGATGYRATVTAVNAAGITATSTIDLNPTKVSVPVTANISTSAVVSGITQNLPFSIDTIPGYQHSVEVPASVCVAGVVHTFASWSDGGARVHTVTAAPGLSLAATFTAGGSCSTFGTLRLSTTNTRTSPVTLDGSSQPATGNVYIFLDTAITNYTRVEFFLDDTAMSRPPIHGESQAPYDFVGGSVPTASPLSLATLTPGTHTVTARALAPTGASVTTATFTVGSTGTTTTTSSTSTTSSSTSTTSSTSTSTTSTSTTSTSTTSTTTVAPPVLGSNMVAWSSVNTRLAPAALQGKALASGSTVYIFYNSTITNFAYVQFFLNNVSGTGPSIHTESQAPYDYVGGSVATASPLVVNLPRGTHTITVRATPSSGAPLMTTATFTVV